MFKGQVFIHRFNDLEKAKEYFEELKQAKSPYKRAELCVEEVKRYNFSTKSERILLDISIVTYR